MQFVLLIETRGSINIIKGVIQTLMCWSIMLGSVFFAHIVQKKRFNFKSFTLILIILGFIYIAEEEDVYRQLWLACADPMANVPRVGDKVFYLPQDYIEQVVICSFTRFTISPIQVCSFSRC